MRRVFGGVRGGEVHVPLYAIFPRGRAERSFGCDVDRVGHQPFQQAREARSRTNRQTHFPVRRARYRAKKLRRQRKNVMPGGNEPIVQRRKRPRYAVDLRSPRVGDERKPHESVSANSRIWASTSMSSSSAAGSLSGSDIQSSTQWISSSPPP